MRLRATVSALICAWMRSLSNCLIVCSMLFPLSFPAFCFCPNSCWWKSQEGYNEWCSHKELSLIISFSKILLHETMLIWLVQKVILRKAFRPSNWSRQNYQSKAVWEKGNLQSGYNYSKYKRENLWQAKAERKDTQIHTALMFIWREPQWFLTRKAPSKEKPPQLYYMRALTCNTNRHRN